MSKYTTQVRWICETEARKESTERIPDGFSGIDTILTLSAPKIFNFDFPIFDEAYRLVLEKKILRHFYMREICEETVGLWKLRLWDKLNVIMPFYNKLYASELLEFNPLWDVDLTIDRNGTKNGNSNEIANENYNNTGNENRNKTDNTSGTRESVTDNNAESISATNSSGTTGTTRQTQDVIRDVSTEWTLHSDTPQGGVLLVDNTDPETVGGKAYLTWAEKKTNEEDRTDTVNENTTGTQNNVETGNRSDTGHGTSAENVSSENSVSEVNTHTNTSENYKVLSSEINNVEDYIEHVKGKRGGHTYSNMILEFRKTLLNIDEMILRDMEDLFFGLW